MTNYIRFFLRGKDYEELHDLDLERSDFVPSVGDIIYDDIDGSENFYEVLERHFDVSGKRIAVILKKTSPRKPFGEPRQMQTIKMTV